MIEIYKLTSPSGKVYIGKTSKGIDIRLQQHLNEARTRKDTQLHRALRKYEKMDNWDISIIDSAETNEEANFLESHYITVFDTYKNGYNMTFGGDGVDSETASMVRKRYFNTPDGKEWKKILSQKWKEQNPGDWTGKKHTEESRKKMSDSKLGKKWTNEQKQARSELTKKMWDSGVYDNRPPQTEETIQKAAESRRGFKQSDYQKETARKANAKKWIVASPDGIETVVLNLSQFCKENGLDQGNLSRGSHKGWKARKKEP